MLRRILVAFMVALAFIAAGPVFADPAQGAGAGSQTVPGVVSGPSSNTHYSQEPQAPGSISDERPYDNGANPRSGGPHGGTNVANGMAPGNMDAGTNPYATTSTASGFSGMVLAAIVIGVLLVLAMVAMWWRSAGRSYYNATDVLTERPLVERRRGAVTEGPVVERRPLRPSTDPRL